MAITKEQIQLQQPQRLTDNDDGGGSMIGAQVISGELNNLFDDVNPLDRVTGRVSLRKAFLFVNTANTDALGRANVIIAEPPADPLVHITAFYTGDVSDVRADAQEVVEAYVVKGPLSDYALFETQLKGQRAIRLLSQTSAPVPEVSAVYYLANSTGSEQYVKVTSVDSAVSEFYVNNGAKITLRLTTLGISEPLNAEYPGQTIATIYTSGISPNVRTTQVADAARYYGVKPLAVAATVGDLSVNVGSPYSPLVPSTQAEQALVDQFAGAEVVQTLTSGSGTYARPVSFSAVAHSLQIKIEGQQNRGYSYAPNLWPIPYAGTLVVLYRSGGRWYKLADDGTGKLEGDGVGAISFDTGSVTLTLSALPDPSSCIIFQWGSGAHYRQLASEISLLPPAVPFTLEDGLKPGSVSVSWVVGSTTYTATDNGAGQFSGDASGAIAYSSGQGYLVPSQMDAGSEFDFAYSIQTLHQFSTSGAASPATLQLPHTDIVLNSVQANWTVKRTNKNGQLQQSPYSYAVGDGRYVTYGGSPSKTYIKEVTNETVANVTYFAADDGQGGFEGVSGCTIDYATGAVILQLEQTYTYNKAASNEGDASNPSTVWTESSAHDVYSGGTLTLTYARTSDSPTAKTTTVSAPTLTFDLTRGTSDAVLPGSVRFGLGGQILQDVDGTLYSAASLAELTSGQGVVTGTVDYQTGAATLTEYAGINGLALYALIGVRGQPLAEGLYFRTAGDPIRAGSMILLGTAPDGIRISAASDANGNFDHDLISGTVDQETGAVALTFTQPLDPSFMTYNAVVYSYIPMSEDVIGLNAVRLPVDGKVPIYRAGDVVVIHNTQNTGLTNPLPVGAWISLPRVCNVLDVYDQNGSRLPDDVLEKDLAQSRFKVAAGTDLDSYLQPFYARHRVEEMKLVADVQIDGTLTLASQLAAAYSTGDSFVSSALEVGTLQARTMDLFYQKTTDNNWLDVATGDAISAALDTINYPITVTNRGAVGEKWALQFTSSTTFNIVGQLRGVIGTGDTNSTCAPINPITGVPYFAIDYRSWGLGWAAGNMIRFNTTSAFAPVWFARCTLTGDSSTDIDNAIAEIRGGTAR